MDNVPEEVKLSLESLVRRFARVLLEKLVASEQKYRWGNGWMEEDWADPLPTQLLRHIEKGDPIDVAAYCAFAWHHGWKTTPDSYPLKGSEANMRGEAIEAQAIRITALESDLAATRQKLTDAEAQIQILQQGRCGMCDTFADNPVHGSGEGQHAFVTSEAEIMRLNAAVVHEAQRYAALEKRLEEITDKVYGVSAFLVGNGDVCEIAARHLLAALETPACGVCGVELWKHGAHSDPCPGAAVVSEDGL